MNHRLMVVAVCATLGGFTPFAFAQPAASPAAAAAVSPPKHACTKPGEFPGNLATENQRRNWQRAYVDYVDCLKKFINEEQALAEPHLKAANDAINEYNNGVKEYNAQIEKAKGN